MTRPPDAPLGPAASHHSADPARQPRLSKQETLRALAGHVRPHRVAIAIGALLGLVSAAMGLAQPLAAKVMVDALAGGDSIGDILLLLTALVVLGTAAGALGQYVLERSGESVVLSARRSLVVRLVRLRMSDMERSQPGDLLSRVIADTTLLRQITTQSMVSTVVGSFTLLAVVVLMAVLDAVLLGVCLAVVALIGGSSVLVMPRIAHASRQGQEAIGTVASVLERVFGAFRTVKAAGAEEREITGTEAAIHQAWHHGVRVAKLRSLAAMTIGLAIQVSFLAVLGVGGARVSSGAIEVSTLVAFLLLLFQLLSPVSRLIEALSQYQTATAVLGRMAQVERLAIEPKPRGTRTHGAPDHGHQPRGPGPADPAHLRTASAAVEFRDVIFRYRPDLPDVHRGISFRVDGPGLTAFVGPSGAGKTTILALLERFYETTAGHVLVDGRDVRAWPLDQLRASIGYVEQDSPVLAGTLRDNLLYGAPHATEQEIHEVVRRTRLDVLVNSLPMGLDTPVGHRGSALSGGERQRLAIGRALLRRPRLLLLDEATSQLDAVNEQSLRGVVADIATDTTVLVIAHRLSTVTASDRIIVLDEGRIRATGTHEELLRLDALYHELAATQLLTADLPPGPAPNSPEPEIHLTN
ncbi:ABC transporter ATP-binding protein [Streptomyces jumonjinensis]|uniref:ABC transporter ATP-binding protein n=1 Tax=Streptomyces jumonjinensis TaxID=1945 RepID=UPI0037BB98BE